MAGAVGTVGAVGLLGSVDERGSKTDAVGLRIWLFCLFGKLSLPSKSAFFPLTNTFTLTSWRSGPISGRTNPWGINLLSLHATNSFHLSALICSPGTCLITLAFHSGFNDWNMCSITAGLVSIGM